MTDSIKVNHVRYVKLGTKDDNWETACFKEGLIPLGYEKAIDIMKLNWNEEGEKELKQAESRHFNKIKDFYTLDKDTTVWVIFRGAKLYWGRASQEIKCSGTKEDLEKYEADKKQNPKAMEGVAKPYFLYRKIDKGWSCSPIDIKNKDTFDIEQIDGCITKTANTQNSICEFNRKKAPEKVNGYISYLINGGYLNKENQPSYTWENRLELVESLSPTNFEWFVSNIYCQLGYLNLGKVGESTQKDTDLILLSPDKKRVLVQIKTSSNQEEFNVYAEKFKDETEAYFIHHTGTIDTTKAPNKALKLKHIDELLKRVEDEIPNKIPALLEWLKLKCYFGTVESAS